MTVLLERPDHVQLRLPSLPAIARHGMPRLVEATLMPTALFYAGWWSLGSWAGFVAALLWTYGLVARRIVRGREVPGLLILAVVGITGRTAAAFATGSTYIYFLIPVVSTAVVGGAFLASAFTHRPFVSRLAGDFCPLTDEVTDRPAIIQLFRRLTVLWAGVNLLNAGITYWMLTAMSVGLFVGLRAAAAAVVTGLGVLVTVVWSLRVARREGLVGARFA